MEVRLCTALQVLVLQAVVQKVDPATFHECPCPIVSANRHQQACNVQMHLSYGHDDGTFMKPPDNTVSGVVTRTQGLVSQQHSHAFCGMLSHQTAILV